MNTEKFNAAQAAAKESGAALDYSGANLQFANLSQLKILVETDFTGADLYGSYLHGMRVVDRATLKLGRSDLRGADLSSSRLYGAIAENSDIKGANLRSADLSGANLRAADLRCADLTYVIADECDFSAANFEGAVMPSAARRSDFGGSHGFILGHTELKGSSFADSELTAEAEAEAEDEECKFERISFVGATISGAFVRCSILNCDFRGADLTGATFEDCEILNCDFRGAINVPEVRELLNRLF